MRFRGRNEASGSVVNQEPTVNCGMQPQGPKDRILFVYVLMELKKKNTMQVRPSSEDNLFARDKVGK